MSLPVGVPRVTVSSGKPLTGPGGTIRKGHFVFTGPELVTISGEEYTLGGSEPAYLIDGVLSVDLVPQDVPTMNPTDWSYTVSATFADGETWERQMRLSISDTSVLLSDVLTPDPSTPNYVPVKGDPGPPGDDGAPGTPGAPGAAGASAYAVWLAAGNTGTVDDYLASLIGPPGQDKTAGEWVFDITKYGAVGDAQVVHDGAVVGGVAAVTCGTSAPFKPSLAGEKVIIQGAGPAGVTAFVTTFSAYNSASSMALTDTPPTSITNAVVAFGTNNYTAIRAAQAAANAYLDGTGTGVASKPHTFADIYTPPGAFLIDGPLDTSKSGNGQVTFGVYPTTDVKKILRYRGEGSGAGVRHWEQLVPQYGGSCWISTGFYSSTSAQISDLNANGHPGIISGPNEGTSNGLAYGASARFSNIMPMIEGMAFLVPHTAYGITRGAWNFYGCANAHIRDVSISTLGVVPGSDYTSPGTFGTGLSAACLMPAPGNNDLSIIENLSVQGGFTYGPFVAEHCLVSRYMGLYMWAGLVIVGNYAGSVGAVHAVKIQEASIEACAREIYIMGVGSEGIGPRVDIDQLQTESSTPTIDGNSTGALMGAEGRIVLSGLFDPAGVSITQPSGIELVNGQAPRAIRRVTADFTARPIDRTLVCDTTSAGFTATLPDADVNAVEFIFKNVGANTLMIGTTSSQLIYTTSGTGATTATVATGATLRLQAMYNGTAWGWYAV